MFQLAVNAFDYKIISLVDFCDLTAYCFNTKSISKRFSLGSNFLFMVPLVSY